MSGPTPNNEPGVSVELRANGPIVIMGPVVVRDETGEHVEPRLFLCRCGQSLKKPLCDGTHKACGFIAPGVPVIRKPAGS